MSHWGKKKYGETGGLDAVSADTGMEILHKTLLHDDGVVGYGGMRVATIGPMRVGKTTLALSILPMLHYIEHEKKEAYLKNPNRNMNDLQQETIIYRGRKLDYWNCFYDGHFKKCFPDEKHRQLRLFIFHEDDIVFFEKLGYKEDATKFRQLDIYLYKSQDDLYKNLVVGGINVVYVPNKYRLSNLLKTKLNDMRMLTPEDKQWYHEDDRVSVVNVAFWYDLFYYIQGIENQHDRIKSLTFFFDEAHQIFHANAPKPLWYLIDDFAENALIDSGRVNMTIWANCHALNLMYWKILQRFDTFIWLGGSKPDSNYSMVSQYLARVLPKGTFIIEEKQRGFGRAQFPQLQHQPYMVLAKGVV